MRIPFGDFDDRSISVLNVFFYFLTAARGIIITTNSYSLTSAIATTVIYYNYLRSLERIQVGQR